MDALIASYGDDSDSEPDCSPPPPPLPLQPSASCSTTNHNHREESNPLPPPPLDLLNPPNSLGSMDYLQSAGQLSRIRNFPHVEGNYALHVYIPVHIPLGPKKELTQFLKKVSAGVPGLNAVDVDIPLKVLSADDTKLEQVALGRQFHISLGRTVPIRVHQIDSVVAMLDQKLKSQKRYWIDFSDWVVFVNDDQTRTFLSLEVTRGGLAEITKQIEAVNMVYKLHNLPEFYKNARPHISVAWALGDISCVLEKVVAETKKQQRSSTTTSSSSSGRSMHQPRLFTCKFSGIDCKIGSKTYRICKFRQDD